jgi:REP element-mobilizing transposase RayT
VKYRSSWQLPDPIREREAKALRSEDACLLTREQREIVEGQIAETCAHRDWTLHVVNCRSNHVHVVVSADVSDPDRIRIDLKAWTTRALKEMNGSDGRSNWWAERGGIRHINREDDLEAAIVYVRDGQDRKVPRINTNPKRKRGPTSTNPKRKRGREGDT